MKRAAAILVLLIVAVTVFGNQWHEMFSEANGYYNKKQYDKAIIEYKKIVDAGYASPELYYNLGNAYFKSKNISMAILFYEKAKQLSPSDEEINFNLEYAQTFIIDKHVSLPELHIIKWYRNFVSMFNSGIWASISIVCFIFTLFSLLWYLFSRKIALRKTFFFTAVISFIFFVFTLVFSYYRYKDETKSNYAIIVSPVVSVKNSPDQRGSDLFILHEGTKVKVLDSVGSWRKIRISQGSIGWLDSGQILYI